jgi:hypothetical protein
METEVKQYEKPPKNTEAVGAKHRPEKAAGLEHAGESRPHPKSFMDSDYIGLDTLRNRHALHSDGRDAVPRNAPPKRAKCQLCGQWAPRSRCFGWGPCDAHKTFCSLDCLKVYVACNDSREARKRYEQRLFYGIPPKQDSYLATACLFIGGALFALVCWTLLTHPIGG